MIAAPRFPDVAPTAGHYESFFLKARHPTEPQAFWLRHTVHQRPGERTTASLWLTLFEPDRTRAGKATVEGASVPAGGLIAIDGAELHPGRARGALRSPTLDAAWDLTFATAEPESRTLPAAWMYSAPVPRTKSGTPAPGATFAGRVGPFDVTGWRGLLSHNWGAEHAARWIWTHAALEDRGWVELAIGRVAVAGRTTPWIANGALQLDGERHRLGGLRRALVQEEPTQARFVVRGAGALRVEGHVAAPPERFVAWRYADPAGPEHHVAHSSLADLRLQVRRNHGAPEAFVLPMAASYELGTHDDLDGLAVQPYDDGRP